MAAAFARSPHGARTEATRLASESQHDAVVEDFQRVGRKRRTRRGDVHDDLGRARSRRAFGRAQAFDDAVVGEAMAGEEAAGQVDVFGGDAELAALPYPHGRGDVVEIGHGPHVDPGLRHGHHDIGVAEAQRRQHLHGRVGIRDLLAHEVLAGDAEMGGTGGQLRNDLGGREEGHLGAFDARDRASIVALAARLDEFQPGAAEEGGGVLLKPPLGGHGQNERSVVHERGIAHAASPVRRSSQIEAPTAGIGAAAPRRPSTWS